MKKTLYLHFIEDLGNSLLILGFNYYIKHCPEHCKLSTTVVHRRAGILKPQSWANQNYKAWSVNYRVFYSREIKDALNLDSQINAFSNVTFTETIVWHECLRESNRFCYLVNLPAQLFWFCATWNKKKTFHKDLDYVLCNVVSKMVSEYLCRLSHSLGRNKIGELL